MKAVTVGEGREHRRTKDSLLKILTVAVYFYNQRT